MSAMFAIEGHTYVRATSANRVALCIGGDVFSNGSPFSRRDIALDVAALEPGESVAFARIPFSGVDVSRPVVVRRVALESAPTVIGR
jgi:predicted HD phosphohydrolase